MGFRQNFEALCLCGVEKKPEDFPPECGTKYKSSALFAKLSHMLVIRRPGATLLRPGTTMSKRVPKPPLTERQVALVNPCTY